ncbi:MAG: iron-containing redox enzyme family protein [Candidatus Doudnabacteria bacterium]|nr:iron-containing redox enzyme family protein [Candidatus Doudnabacteria bacterium]
MDNQINPVTTPQEAITQFVGEQFMEWVMDFLKNQAMAWESLKVIANARPKPEKIKKFMLQRFLAAEAFTGGREGDPGFLGFAIANLSESSDPAAEHALELLDNKRNEEMIGTEGSADPSSNIHKDLWLRLLKALGVTDEELKRAEAKEPTRNYIADLADVYSSAEWQTTIAAFAAHEKLIPEEYAAVATMLKSNTQVTENDLEVLTWHAKGDAKYVIETSRILERVAVDDEGKNLIFQGVQMQLQARKDYYEGLSKYLLDSNQAV